MIRTRPASMRRDFGLAAALFAITLNFLQPLAHAALMRDGGPMSATLWGVFCLPAVGQDEQQGSVPTAAKIHECCLGLSQAPALAEAPTAFLIVEPVVIVVRFVTAVQSLAPVGIRDGPNQPRGPPSFA
jgi:hypothetical protein